MNQRTVRVDDGLADLIDAIVTATSSTTEVPALNQAEVMRLLMHQGAGDLLDGDVEVDDADLLDLIPEHDLVLFERERFKEGEAKLRRLRADFETMWRRHIKRRFENGMRPEQLERFALNARQDAHILFRREDERRREVLGWLDAMVAEARQAHDDSDVDLLDPAEVFASYEGVERGRQAAEVDVLMSDLVGTARQRLDAVHIADRDAIARALAKEHGVALDAAREAVETAASAEQRVEADGGERQ